MPKGCRRELVIEKFRFTETVVSARIVELLGDVPGGRDWKKHDHKQWMEAVQKSDSMYGIDAHD